MTPRETCFRLARMTFVIAIFGLVVEACQHTLQHIGGLVFLLASSIFSMAITRKNPIGKGMP